MWGFKTLAWK
jgi:hypothetical protein